MYTPDKLGGKQGARQLQTIENHDPMQVVRSLMVAKQCNATTTIEQAHSLQVRRCVRRGGGDRDPH
jgi:hypothetical protein